MRPATAFSLNFARLFSQLLSDPANQEANRATVDQMLAETHEAVTLSWDNWQLVAAGDVLPRNQPGVKDLVARMAAHGVREIQFSSNVEPGHVLGAIWILINEPVIGDGGANASARLVKLGTSGVRFAAVAAPEPPPAVATPTSSALAMSLDFDLYELEPEAAKRDSGAHVAPVKADPSTQMYAHFSSAKETPEQLLSRLQTLKNVDQLAQTLEAIANLVNNARVAQQTGGAADLVTGMLAAEARFTEQSAKRVFTLVARRVVTHSLLLAFAADLPRSRERHSQYMALFARFGDDAVDALIEQLVYAELAKERRVLFNAIVELKRGVPALVRMLSDTRWYVARNAAELLGEMRAVEAEAELIKCLRHDDARVRRSSAAALAKLGTAGALAALTEAMRDPSPNVRMVAALAIAMRKEGRSTAIFIRALADEQDPEVQRALFIALARLGTPEGVRRLISEAEPDTRFFRKKPVGARVAAVQALAEARTPEAMAALEMLAKDKEREVREAATKGISGGGPQPARAGGGW